jgi:hypothetical protein
MKPQPATTGLNSGAVGVHIYGGLGNQLFQYACGRALALRCGGTLQLDNRDFHAGHGQIFGLHHFNIAAKSDEDPDWPPAKKNGMRYLLWRYLKLSPVLVRERSAAFDPSVLTLKGNSWLHGYWQSERYFEDFSDQIRDELAITTAPSERNRQLLAEIRDLPAISLHIRRGDYVSDRKAHAVHGTCSLDYYQEAVRRIADKMTSDPVVFVFSDEPDWAKQHLDLPQETRFLDHNDSQFNYEDLRLMAACGHHIIANSSFSWWGAWLNPSAEKTVIAPARWFADPAVTNPEITPSSWIRLAG